jgi:hypothetical protein
MLQTDDVRLLSLSAYHVRPRMEERTTTPMPARQTTTTDESTLGNWGVGLAAGGHDGS